MTAQTKALPSTAKVTVAGEQSEVIEPAPPAGHVRTAIATSSIDVSATGTWRWLIAVKSSRQCCCFAARIGFICAGMYRSMIP